MHTHRPNESNAPQQCPATHVVGNHPAHFACMRSGEEGGSWEPAPRARFPPQSGCAPAPAPAAGCSRRRSADTAARQSRSPRCRRRRSQSRRSPPRCRRCPPARRVRTGGGRGRTGRAAPRGARAPAPTAPAAPHLHATAAPQARVQSSGSRFTRPQNRARARGRWRLQMIWTTRRVCAAPGGCRGGRYLRRSCAADRRLPIQNITEVPLSTNATRASAIGGSAGIA